MEIKTIMSSPYNLGLSGNIKEACYSRVSVGISLQIKGFPILAVLQICFIACRSSHGSNWSFGRPSKCPLWPLEPRKLSSWMKILQYMTGCAIGCSEVTKTTVTCLLKACLCHCSGKCLDWVASLDMWTTPTYFMYTLTDWQTYGTHKHFS